MFHFIDDLITGFIYLALTAGGAGILQDFLDLAEKNPRIELMSYSKYTKMLTDDE